MGWGCGGGGGGGGEGEEEEGEEGGGVHGWEMGFGVSVSLLEGGF